MKKLILISLLASIYSSYAASGLGGTPLSPVFSTTSISNIVSGSFIASTNGTGQNPYFVNQTNTGTISIYSARIGLGQPINAIEWHNSTGGHGGVDARVSAINDHNGVDTPELALSSNFNMAQTLGFNGTDHLGATPQGTGYTWGSLNTFYLQRNITADAVTTTGDSAGFGWQCDYWNGSSFINRGFGLIYEPLDTAGNTILRIYPVFKGQTNGLFTDPTNPGMSDDGTDISQGGFGTNTFFYKNLSSSNSIFAGSQYRNSTNSSFAPDMNIGCSETNVGAAFTLSVPINVLAAATERQVIHFIIRTNGLAGSPFALTTPAPVKATGTAFVTNTTDVEVTVYGRVYTNYNYRPIF